MPLYHFILEIEQLKNKLSHYLSTSPENLSFTWNKFDALLSLIWFLKDTTKITKLVYTSKSVHQDIILKIAKLLKLEIEEISLYPDISEIKNKLSDQDLLIIGNPIYPLGCNIPIKRIAKLSEKKGFQVIFDISLSFFWLGYDLYKTPIKYAFFSLNPYNPNSSPVIIFHKEFNFKYLINPIEHWSLGNIDIEYAQKVDILKKIDQKHKETLEIFQKFRFKEFCPQKKFPLLLSMVAPTEIDIKKLSSLFQFNDIKFQIIQTTPAVVIIPIYGLINKNTDNIFSQILEKLF